MVSLSSRRIGSPGAGSLARLGRHRLAPSMKTLARGASTSSRSLTAQASHVRAAPRPQGRAHASPVPCLPLHRGGKVPPRPREPA